MLNRNKLFDFKRCLVKHLFFLVDKKTVIFIFISQFSFSQKADFFEYYKIINDAEISSLNKKHKKSDSLYEIAFSLVDKPFKEDYYLAALNAENLNDSKKVYYFLKEAIKKGLSFKRIKNNKKKIKQFCKSEHYKILKSEYEETRKEYLASIDLHMKSKLESMIKIDQSVRKPIFGNVKKMIKIDLENYKQLVEIINTNDQKWPGFSTIGEITPKGKYDVTGNISLLLLHFSKEQIETLKPYILDAVYNGEIYPYHFARIIDYTIGKKITRSSSGEINICYLYGTYLNSKICDCEVAREEREKIGFESISDYHRKRESKYHCEK